MGLTIFLFSIFIINFIATFAYSINTCAELDVWNSVRLFIPGALLLQLYIEKLKSEPLEIYESKFKVGQKIKSKESIDPNWGSPMYYDPYHPFSTLRRPIEIKKTLKIQMIDKLNRIYYTDDGEYSFAKLECYGQPLKSAWIIKQRKGPKRERR